MEIKIKKMVGSIHDCECCGMYSAEGVFVFLNENLIWKKYSDGHLYAEQSEKSLLDSVLDAWNNLIVEEINSQYTEENRIKWNVDYPGNGIARTKNSWLEYKNSILDHQKESMFHVKSNCDNLPYDEVLQAKLIAVWMEDSTGESVNIVCENISEEEVVNMQ